MTEQRRRTIFYLNLALSLLFLIGGGVLLFLTYRQSANVHPPVAYQTLPSGEPAPDFSLPTLAGEIVSLEAYRGQVVVVNLWATWCPPCIAEMPVLNAFYQAHQTDGLVVLAINDQEAAAVVQQFITQNEFTFPVLLDREAEVIERYRVPGLPTTFIIDRDGRLQHIHTGLITDQQLKEFVEPLL